MKKTLFFITAIVISFAASAQHYRCIIPGIKNYFINSTGYLRGIRIDSVKANGADTILYPFHSARGKYDIYGGSQYPPLDSTGGSWLGKTITIKPDGTHIFQNMWDTVVIRTQANLNETWMLYNDASATYYEATLMALDTMIVLGSIDSVRRIAIVAKDGNGILVNDPMNNQEIIISKTKGFVQIFDLYTFPMREPGTTYQQGFDYFLDKLVSRSNADIAGSAPFHVVQFINPERLDFYDFNVGDVFEFHREEGYHGKPGTQYILEKVLKRTELSPVQTQYVLGGWKWYYVTQAPPTRITVGILDSFTISKGQLLCDTTGMPDEWNMKALYTYLPHDTSYCYLSALYGDAVHGIDYSSARASLYHCGSQASIFKIKFGRVFHTDCYDSVPNGTDYERLIYVEKNGKPCGSYHPLDISSPTTSSDIRIYPNPVQHKLYIEGISIGTAISLVDITGRIVYQSVAATSTTSIDMSLYSPGNYLLQMLHEDGSRKLTKLVKL